MRPKVALAVAVGLACSCAATSAAVASVTYEIQDQKAGTTYFLGSVTVPSFITDFVSFTIPSSQVAATSNTGGFTSVAFTPAFNDTIICSNQSAPCSVTRLTDPAGGGDNIALPFGGFQAVGDYVETTGPFEFSVDVTETTTPEPGSVGLMAAGVLALGVLRYRSSRGNP